MNDGMETEKGYWSQIEYTDSIIPGYPEYYPLIIRISSQGQLPADIREEYNYTKTIKISKYSINFNHSDIENIDRPRDQDELIGSEKPLELKFRVTKEMAENVTSLRIEIKLQPFNVTWLSSDLFILDIDFRKEGDANDILKASLFTVIPLIFIAINYKIYTHINSQFVRNIRWRQIPRYYTIYFMRLFKFRNFLKRKKRDPTRRLL